MTTIITASKLLTMNSRMGVIQDAAVAVRGGVIIESGKRNRILRLHPRARVLDLPGTVLMPGLINAHTHTELPALPDPVKANTFPEWLYRLIRAKKHIKERDYREASIQNIEYMIRTGTTTIAEICTHGASPAVLKKSGLRALVFHEVISMHPYKGPRPSLCIPRSSRLIRHGLSPHTPYTVSRQVLSSIWRIVENKGARLCMHVAESRDEIRLLRGERSGLDALYGFAGWDRKWLPKASSPFLYLNDLGLLSRRFLAVHAVHADDRDISMLEDAGASVAHCPRSNKLTGAGRLPLEKILTKKIAVGIGTDSLASAPSLSLWDEMRHALRIHRRYGVAAQDILRLGTSSGAEALGMGDEIGSIEPGKQADIIAVPLPMDQKAGLYDSLLNDTEYCIMNMVAGRILYSKGI